MKPDDICVKFSEQNSRLRISEMEGPEEDTSKWVLIEGPPEALEFLGDLLHAQAIYTADDGFDISPTGAGSALFSKDSNVAIYIHVLRDEADQ